MKATGIVRRIDELGRVVIPKEIRRTQRIRQGDTLEILRQPMGKWCSKNILLLWSWGAFPACMPKCSPRVWTVRC